MNLSALEKALLPLVCPLLQSLWTSTLLPAIQKAAVSGSPELQVLDSAGVAALDAVVQGELKVLAAI